MRGANLGLLLYGDASVIYARFKRISTGYEPRHIDFVDKQSCTLANIRLPLHTSFCWFCSTMEQAYCMVGN